MKKKIAVFMVCLLLAVTTAACAGLSKVDTDEQSQAEAGNTSEAVTQDDQTAAMKGETFETENFSLIIPNGWEMMEVDGGVQIYKMSGEIVEVHFRGSGQGDDHAQQQVMSVAEQYNGSTPKEVEFLNKTFWTTSFTAAGVSQTSYLRIEDGVLVSVKIAGDAQSKEIQGILQTIKLK
jgi:hypothetical protein